MRICMLTSSYPKSPGDGTAPFIESIATHVAAQGHEVHVLAPFHPDIRRNPIEDGVHLHFFRYTPLPGLYLWGYASSLSADIRVKPAIYLLAPFVVTAMARALHQLLHDARPEILHAHWVIPNAPVPAFFARHRGIPLVVSLHGSDVYLAERLAPVGAVARVCFKVAGAITACSQDLRGRAVTLGADPAKTRVIPYGVDTQRFTPMQGPPPYPWSDSPVILAIGRLVHKKGFEYLIRAAPLVLAEHSDAHFVLIGDGDLRPALEREANEVGVSEHMHFLGAIPHYDIPRYLAACDIFVVPSVQDESGNVDGLPNTLLEGMATGRAVVATRVAGIPQVIHDGSNGLLIPPSDHVALARAIIRLLAAPHLRTELGLRARHTVQEQYSWADVARQFVDIYEGLAESQRSR